MLAGTRFRSSAMQCVSRGLNAGVFGESAQAAGSGVPVHSVPRLLQDRSVRAVGDARSMARPTAGGSGTRTILVPLPHTRSTR